MVRRRSVTCSATGLPSRRRAIVDGCSGARPRQRSAASVASRSIRATTSVAVAPLPAGIRMARCRAMSARSQVEDSSATWWRASAISIGSPIPDGRGRWSSLAGVSRSGSRPADRAWVRQVSCSVIASVPCFLDGLEVTAADRSRRAIVSRSGWSPSFSALQRRISSSCLVFTWALRWDRTSRTASGMQVMSAGPSSGPSGWRSQVTPRRRVSSPRKAASYSQPMVRCCFLRNLASSDNHRPVGSWTLAAITAWVCS